MKHVIITVFVRGLFQESHNIVKENIRHDLLLTMCIYMHQQEDNWFWVIYFAIPWGFRISRGIVSWIGNCDGPGDVL